MALCRVRGAALLGIEAVVVDVEVDSRRGLPGVLTVGLPDTTVRESEERVRGAIRNSTGAEGAQVIHSQSKQTHTAGLQSRPATEYGVLKSD